MGYCEIEQLLRDHVGFLPPDIVCCGKISDLESKLKMENKITIIEGPTPVFEDISDGWALGLNESLSCMTRSSLRFEH